MGTEKARPRIGRIKSLTTAFVENVAFVLAKEWMTFNEPIPDFHSRFPGKLEACVDQPFQTFEGKDLYPGLIKKAAILFYLLIKNHPFQNGNKRLAMATLFYFLFQNKKWIKVDNQELYNFARWVAESNAKLKDDTVRAI